MVDSNVKLPPPDDNVLRAVVREPSRQVRRAGALRLRGGRALRRQLRGRRARVRDGAEQRHAGRRQGRAARLQGAAAREPGAELRAGVRQGAGASPSRANGTPCRRATAGAPCGSTRSTPPKPAVFEALRGVVLHDWTDATAAEQRTAAVRALAKKYKVKHEVPRGARRLNEPARSRVWLVADAASSRWRCCAAPARAHEMTHGRDGGARDLAGRVPLALVGRERQAPDGRRPHAALARELRAPGRTSCTAAPAASRAR